MKTLRFPALLAWLFFGVIVVGGLLHFVKREISEHQVSANSSDQKAAPKTSVAQDESNASSKPVPSPTTAAPSLRWDTIEGLFNQASSGKLISKQDAERFLQVKGATALNLLAVAAATENEEFARRAAALFPDHPAVQLAVLSKNLFPAERAEWIARFKDSVPDNPIPFVYSALEAFQRNDSASALAEAASAIEKPGLYMWSAEFIDAIQELYESKGYTPLEAKLLSVSAESITQLTDFQKLGSSLMKWRKDTLENGDLSDGEEILRTVYGLGRLFQSPEGSRTLINQLVGIGLEGAALKAMPSESQPAFLDVPRTQREAEMARIRDFARNSGQEVMSLIQRDPNLLAGFLQHRRDEGEYQALLWLKEQAK
ncbi:hypothetical protein ACXR0O_11115 [Verrucomicrobiota bacterium sgz303538]